MSKPKHIYIASIEVRPLSGCQMSLEFAGAFTIGFIPAYTEEEARAKILAALAEDHYELVDMEYCLRYSRRDWDAPECKIKSGVDEAQVTGDMIYGEFQCWPRGVPVAI
jgi:hypothetical protein